MPTAETIDYVYDDDNQPPGTGSGRLVQIAASATGTASITYDAIGRVATVTSPHAVTTATTWDGPLPLTETWTGGPFGAATHTLTRTWTPGDLRPHGLQVDSEPETTFAFDDDGLLTHAGPLTLTHDPASGVLTGTVVSALASAVTANGFGELSQLRHTANGTTLLRETILTRDKLGRVLTLEREQDGVTETLAYTYDPHGRLIEERVNGVLQSTWTWDANHNRLTASTPSATVTVYDAQDRLLSINNGAVSWTWDDAGSLVSRTAANQTTLYAINAFGQLERVTLPSGPVVEYAYDGAGRRVSRRVNGAVTDTWIYQDALNPVAWFDGAGQLKATFVYASLPHVPDLMITPTATYRLVTDHLGSVTAVVNVVTGAVVQRMRYDTFGVVLSDSQPGLQPFGFAGGLYDDATGLVRFGARDYDAEVGRWISKDPVRFDGGTNLFAYVGGDPVNFTDPNGTDRTSISIVFLSAILGGAIYFDLHSTDVINDINKTSETLPEPMDGGGAPDAYRHCYASCVYSDVFGEDAVVCYGDIREYWAEERRSETEPPEYRLQDKFNNRVGSSLRGGDCRQRCLDALSLFDGRPTLIYWSEDEMNQIDRNFFRNQKN